MVIPKYFTHGVSNWIRGIGWSGDYVLLCFPNILWFLREIVFTERKSYERIGHTMQFQQQIKCSAH